MAIETSLYDSGKVSSWSPSEISDPAGSLRVTRKHRRIIEQLASAVGLDDFGLAGGAAMDDFDNDGFFDVGGFDACILVKP